MDTTFIQLLKKQINLFQKKNKPSLLIANTIKGKGISFMENKFESHYQVLDKDMYLKSLSEIPNHKSI